MKRRHFLSAGAALTLSPAAFGQTFANRPVRLIVPFATGGSTDVIARTLSEALGRELGQPVVVENRGGAGGMIGVQEVLRAQPDGHTLLMVSPSNTAAVPAMNPKSYKPLTDFTPVMNVAAAPWLIAVHPSFPARNYGEFLAELKRHPGRHSYASSGVGGIIHLHMELFKALTGTFITHIPYRGAGPAVADVMGGQVAIAVDSPTSLTAIRDGRLIPIAVAAPQRMKDYPQMLTFAEADLPALNHMSHFGVLGPKNLPRPVVDSLNAALKKVLQDPAVRKRLEDADTTVIGSTPDAFASEIATRYEQLSRLVADRKLSAS